MQLVAKTLLEQLGSQLRAKREKLTKPPGIALVWIGDDPQTGLFVKAKQKKAAELGCQFFLHHLEKVSERHLEALILSLDQKKDVQGIIIQLPLPEVFKPERFINLLSPTKDIDGLLSNSPYLPPTPQGILALLKHYKINPANHKTVIIGAGRLVGAPLAKLFHDHNWPVTIITNQAQQDVALISQHNLLISCTGVENLITPAMVHPEMVVIDGSGVDVDVSTIETLVKAVTPKKGAIGPLTVHYLFDNLLTALID